MDQLHQSGRSNQPRCERLQLKDRVLWARTIHASHRIVGTNLLVEDDCGDCLMLTLYSSIPIGQDTNDYFPQGSYLAILAPYMKNSADDPSKNLFLRCDNPECVRLFDTHRSWLAAKQGKKLVDTDGLDPSKLRTAGNEAFIEGRWEKAARLYMRALQCSHINQADKLACNSNLSEVRIRQEQWEAADLSARAALDIDSHHKKALYRLATALLRLNKIQEAESIIINGDASKDTSFQNLAEQLSRLKEEQSGRYNLAKMHAEAKRTPGKALATFHAAYTSSSIKRGVEISRGESFSYRGTLAVKEIRANTMVSSSKALVYSAGGVEAMLDYNIDPYTRQTIHGASMELETELVSLMHRRPSTRSAVYSLTSDNTGSDITTDNKIDSGRIQRIVTSNVFGVSAEEEVVTAWNQYKDFQQRRPWEEMEAAAKLENAKTGSGLWLNESLFNHSCTANCSWRQIGDQIFVWTTRDIAAGDELCVPYLDIDEKSFDDRVCTFQRWIQPGVGFACQCDVCGVMRNNKELRRIDAEVHSAYKQAAASVSKDQVPMAVAAERVLPGNKRKKYLKFLSQFPRPIQHSAAYRLWIMEGTCLTHFHSNARGALTAYEKAAEIKYTIKGGHCLGRAKDLWRIVGASMACEDPSKAQKVLDSVYSDIFASFYIPNKNQVFRDLTLNYTMPWWADSFDLGRQAALEVLIERTIKSAASAGARKPLKSKKGRKK